MTVASAARREAPGLVSVPTTPTRGLPTEVAQANARHASKELQRHVGAFKIDAKAAMLPRLRRAVGFSARAHAVSAKGHRSDVPWMVTLTYAGDNSAWSPEHLTRAMDAVRIWCKREGFACRYVWVAELQQRGVIHYHAVFWLPVGVRMPHWDSRGWWPYGMSNTLKAKHAAGYLMSYLKKGSHDGEFPKGSRRYGVGGLDHALRRARRWLGCPAFVQGNASIWDDWKRAEGGGWRSPSGDCVPSEFARVFVGDGWCLQRVHAHPVSIAAAGPFSWLSDRERAIGSMQ